ncbi:hypothetical protein Aduo_004199 [Ancylostoma duodenale]
MNCADDGELVKSAGFLVVVGSQAISGFLSAIISAAALIQCRKLHFHINCKVLILSMLLLYIVHSIFITTLQVTQLIRYLVSDPCQVGLPAAVCLALRLPATACMISFAALQFAIVVERAVAVWKHRSYDKYGSHIGFGLIAICIAIPLLVTFWIVADIDVHERQAFCSAATSRTAQRVASVNIGICCLDLLTLLGIVAILAFNSLFTKRSRFNLQSSYQFRENISVIRIMLPLTIFQTLCYAFFSISNAVISMFTGSLPNITHRILFTSTYVIPYYTLVSPILLLLVIKWSHQMKTTELKRLTKHIDNERDAYFRTYEQMWSLAAIDMKKEGK